MDLDQTVAANSQASFGQYDPAHSGNTNYRVFSSTYVNAKNVKITGGTWNGNSPQQPSVSSLASNQWTSAYGFTCPFQFWGVDGITIRDVRIFQPQAYAIHLVNCQHVIIEDVDIDGIVGFHGNDCVHINGPATDIHMERLKLHTGDDHIAINADDGSSTGSLVSGTNWVCSGPVTDVRITDVSLWNGRSATAPNGAIRLLSTASLIDNVIIKDVSGTTASWAILMQVFTGSLVGGSGNIGRVVFEDLNLDCNGSPVIQVNVPVASLEISRRYRSTPQNSHDLELTSGASIPLLRVSGDWYQPSGSTNAVAAVHVESGSVGTLSLSGCSYRSSSGASPLVLVEGGTVDTIELNADANGLTNMVNITGGSVTNLFLRGAHRNAGGGTPLAISSGATLTNFVYGSGTYPLVFDHNSVAAYSGSGTITHNNDYN
jgi:hypothetical protein